MKLSEAKTEADIILQKAQMFLERDHGVNPVLFTVSREDKSVTATTVKTKTNRERTELCDLMSELSSISSAFILIQDVYLKWSDKPVVKIDKEAEDTSTALIAQVYTEEGTALKQMIYFRHGETYSYCTQDWVDYNPFKYAIQNPFVKKVN